MSSKDNQDVELTDFLLGDDSVSQSLQSEKESNVKKTITFKDQPLFINSKDWRDSFMLKAQILTCFFCMITVGLNDQTVGSLIPTLTKQYSVNQTSISTVFALQFLGYATSALSNEILHSNLGRCGVMTLANCFLLITYVVNAFKPPIFIFIAVYYFTGLGVGLLDSCMNVWLSSLVDHNELMGLLHGFYGIGSVISPPLISHILKWFNDDFKIFYIFLAILAITGGVLSQFFFKSESKLKYEYERACAHDDEEGGQEVTLKTVLRNRTVMSFSAYLFLYIGAEVSIGSWLLSYLMKVKGLDQISASYIVSWFWIGLTVGRILLGFVTKFFKNEYRANLKYSALSLFVYLIYTVFTLSTTNKTAHFKLLTNLIMFIDGIFIGPLFPTSSVTLMKILPPNLHVSAVGIMSSLGGSGAAILPFLVGSITHVTKLDYLPLFITAMLTGYVVIWVLMPKLCKVDYSF
ncbi:unnamed protein product [Wickerhamomyces anomalus]